MPDKPRLERVMLTICSACLDGAGGECHTPGCALWINRAPDVQLRSKVEWSERSAKPAPVLQEETRHERGSLGRHVVAKSAEVDAWPDERKPAYVRQEETGTQELARVRECLEKLRDRTHPESDECTIAREGLHHLAASLPSGGGLTERAGEFLAPVNLRFGAEDRAQAEALLSSVLDGQAVWLETPSDCDLPEAPIGVWAHVEADLPSGDGERGVDFDPRTIRKLLRELDVGARLELIAGSLMRVDGPTLSLVLDADDVTALRGIAAPAAPPSGETGGPISDDDLQQIVEAVIMELRMHAQRDRGRREVAERVVSLVRERLAAPPAGETGSLREQLQAEGEAASRASAALAAARPERFAGETGDGRELREWTIHQNHSSAGDGGLRHHWIEVDGPLLKETDAYESIPPVRVREIPSEGTRA